METCKHCEGLGWFTALLYDKYGGPYMETLFCLACEGRGEKTYVVN